MNLKLKYGNSAVSAEFHPPQQFAELRPKHIATLQSPEKIIAHALDKPIGIYPFNEVFRNSGHLTIVVPDDLHRSGGAFYLPILIRRLRELGIPLYEITILVGGVWGAQRNGVPALLGIEQSASDRPNIVYHDCNDIKTLEYIGQTRRGTPVFVNRLLLDAENVIVCGTIKHESFSGYSGGPCMIVPNCAGRETIERSFALTLDPDRPRIHPGCYNGAIKGNPFQEDVREAFRFITVNFLLHTIMNARDKMIGAVGGEPLQAYSAGCRFVDNVYRVPIDEPADLVIVSCGGLPYDKSYDSAHRALHHAVKAVRPGGVIIFVAECTDGLGQPDFSEWFENNTVEKAYKTLLQSYRGIGAKALSTMQKAEDLHIIAVTEIDSSLVENMGLIPAVSLPEALHKTRELITDIDSCYVLPNGSSTIPYFQQK